MPNLLDQYAQIADPQAREVADRLERGDDPSLVARESSFTPSALVLALARVGLEANGALGPTLTQTPTRHPGLVKVLGREATIAALFPDASRASRLALGAGLLQILDAWDASHRTAQAADDLGEEATAAAWHLIAHRREPDLSNATYWSGRVDLAAYRSLPPLARPLLAEPGTEPTWAGRLLTGPAGAWDPAAWVEIAGHVRPGSPQEPLARRLQRAEMLALLGESLARVTA